MRLASLLLEDGRYEEAVPVFERATQLRPSSARMVRKAPRRCDASRKLRRARPSATVAGSSPRGYSYCAYRWPLDGVARWPLPMSARRTPIGSLPH